MKHCGAPDVRVFVQPEQKVIATTSKDVGELVLPPATLNIVEYDPKIHKDAKGVICTLEGAPCDFFLVPCTNKKFHATLWSLMPKPVDDRSKANMEMKDYVSKYKEATMSNKNTNPIQKCTIPCAVNTKVINEHEELLLYMPKKVAAKPNKRDAHIDLDMEGKSKQAKRSSA